MKRSIPFSVTSVTTLALCLPAMAQHEHGGDIIVGVSGAGQLKFEFDEDILSGLEFIELPPSVAPGIAGWIGDDPGFDHLGTAEPDEDFYPMAGGAMIRLVGVDVDAALFVRAATLGSPVAISPSPTLGSLTLGDEELHTHGLWHIDSEATGYDSFQSVWHGTFMFVDVGTTGYADSDPFTLGFVPVPEPMSLGLFGLGMALIVRRRR